MKNHHNKVSAFESKKITRTKKQIRTNKPINHTGKGPVA